ncbi:MAG: prolipoprotein diacylglyceryl transferase, partial [Pyrinomonadaceae bacterium]|nr:prolipoprotein diacylglyceryl transferase [Phycisphaerales bacterium]
MTLAAWLHTLSPFILRMTETVGIRWYGMAYLAGFAMAYLVLLRLARKGRVSIPPERVADAIMWLIGGVLVGGRLGFVIFYEPDKIWTITSSFPFWDVLAIHHGGMASHGGMAGVAVAGWRISRGWRAQDGRIVGRTSVWHLLDIAAIISPFGLFFGRIANFINGELLGKIESPPGIEGPWWTVQFPQELLTSGHAPALTEPQQQQL